MLESEDSEYDSDSSFERESVETAYDSSSSFESAETEYDPSPDFDQTVLDFVHNGGFARYFRRCVRFLVNLEHIWIDQPHIMGDLTEFEVETFRGAWSAVIETTMSIIRTHRIHLKGLEIENPGGPHCPPNISVLQPVSRAPNLLDSIKNLHLELYVAEDKREWCHDCCFNEGSRHLQVQIRRYQRSYES